MNVIKQRKPQTEQQTLARNEGRGLGQVGMIISCITELYKLGLISEQEKNNTLGNMYICRARILVYQKERMQKAGTWKEPMGEL